MGVEGLPELPLPDDVIAFGTANKDGVWVQAARRSTREACCVTCGGHGRLALVAVRPKLYAMRCAACRAEEAQS